MMFLKPETVARNMGPERNYLSRVDLGGNNKVTPEIVEVVNIEEVSIEVEVNEAPVSTLIVEEKASLGRTGSNIPDYLKQTIAALANEGTKQTDIAKEFNVANSTVSNFANGLNNSREVDPELNAINKKAEANRTTIENEALNKTMMALGLLSENDVMCLGAKDKTIVAANLSKVAANMRDKAVNVNSDNRVQMVIHSPPVRQTYHYPEVEVG